MNNNLWLKIFRSVGIVFFVTVSIIIVYFINSHKYEEVIKLLVPLGVLISALIASYSIMVSIDNANKIEEEKKTQKLHSRLDTSFYMLEKNKENIRLLECFPKADNPLSHKKSILDILGISLDNLGKLEKCETVSPVIVARLESYILGMKFIVEKSPEARGIPIPTEFDVQLKNFKGVTDNTITSLTEEHSEKKANP